MAAPKGAYSKMVEIFKKFIWGGPQQHKKWALIFLQGMTRKRGKGA